MGLIDDQAVGQFLDFGDGGLTFAAADGVTFAAFVRHDSFQNWGRILYLYDSGGTQYIDYAYQSPWEVTSNGTGVGGSHVYLNVDSYYSEGDYNLTFSFFSTAGQPGSIQDDAGSGTDAGDTLD